MNFITLNPDSYALLKNSETQKTLIPKLLQSRRSLRLPTLTLAKVQVSTPAWSCVLGLWGSNEIAGHPEA
jgi:hypothetical protein